jgi:PAS domain S-box-containing protein
MSGLLPAAAGLLVGLVLSFAVLMPRARRRLECALAARETRLELAMGAAKLGAWDWDLLADRVEWSDSLWAVSGLDRARTVLTRASFIAAIHPDDRAAMQVAIDAALDGDAPFHHEARMVKGDGEVRWMSSHGRVLRDDKGRALRMVGIDIDITALKRAEAELAESEARFRVAFDLAAIGMILVRPDGGLFKVNRALCELLGYSEQELLGMSFMSLTHPEDLPASREMQRRLLAGELAVGTIEKRYLRRDGHSVWCHVSVASVRDRNNQPLYQVTQVQDIDARKRAEAQLEGSEARFTTAFESAAIGMALVQPDGRWLKVNTALCELLGYSAEQMLATDFQTLTHPDELPETVSLIRQLHAGDIAQVHQEKRYLTASGAYRWVRVSVSLVRDRDGRPLYHVTQVSDIEARHRAETALMAAKQLAEYREREKSLLLERLNEAQSVAKIGSWSLDKLSGAVWWSDEMYRIFALDPATYVPSVKNNARYFHREDKHNYHRTIERALREGHDFECEARIVAGDGTIKHIADHGQLEHDADGRLVRIYGTFQDVSERRQLEAQLREAQKMESLGALAGGVAHDFNNLLSVILGNAQLARLQSKDPRLLIDKIEHIEQAGQRAKTLVEQILAFSRRKPLSFEPVDLAEVAREALRLLRATIPSGVAITATIPEALPAVMADASQLHQVVMNLFTNAWHAVRDIEGREANVHIEIETQHLEQAVTNLLGAGLGAGEYLCISVRDNGIGMDAATRARVFEPFFTTRAMGEGTGLGLSVVHGIISAHHGAINVESTPGEGTVFRIHLPVARGVTASVHDLHPAAGQLPEQIGGRVLYIDDEPAMTMLVRELVADDSVSVSVATDPLAALEEIRRAPDAYDLVVTDFNMPGLSGLDLARELAQLEPTLPVVVSSGYVTPALQEAADSGRIRALINKIETSEVLPRLVREILANTARTPARETRMASPGGQ